MKNNRNIKLSYCTALMLCLATSQTLFATDEKMVINEVTKLEKITIGLTRTNSTISNTAASVEVITNEDIERNMATGVEDIFKYTPGVQVRSNSRFGIQSIAIRGVEDNRIKVLIDGVSQGNYFNPGGPNFLVSPRVIVDTDMLKAVEIIKGSASSLHGSDAIGGVVAFETLDPQDLLKSGANFGGFFKVNYAASDNTFSETIATAGKKGNLEALLSYTRRDGNEVKNFGNPLSMDTNSNNVLLKLQHQLNDENRLEFTGSYIDNSSKGDQIYKGFTNGKGNDSKEQYQVGIKHIWNLDALVANNIIWQLDYLSKNDIARTSRFGGASAGRPPFVRPKPPYQNNRDYTYEEKGYQLDVQLDKEFEISKTQHYILYGMTYLDKDIRNENIDTRNGISSSVFYVPSATDKKFGVFLQDEISVGNLTITPGIRYDSFETNPGDSSLNPSMNSADKYRKIENDAWTARLGAIYKINNNHSVFAQFSQGYRAPDFKELFYSFGNPTHGYINEPNPDLKPEESISYELGWRHITQNSSNEIAFFYNDYKNFIEENQKVGGNFTPSNPTIFKSLNIGKATIKGVEFSNKLLWDDFVPIKGFSSKIAFAYTEGKDDDGNPINSVNPWNAVVGVNYDTNNYGGSINLSYTAKKDKKDINNQTPSFGGGDNIIPISSATVVDITAYYKPLKNLILRAGLFNVTNEEYYNWSDVRGLSSENKDLTQPSRYWAITARYDF